MNSTGTILAALVAGFIGGVFGTYFPGASRATVSETVRARNYSLVDKDGQEIAFWGVDQGHNAVLAFGAHERVYSGREQPSPGDSVGNIRAPENQTTALGVVSGKAFLRMRAPEGRERVRILIGTSGKPALIMDDDTGPRCVLGIEESG